MRPDRFIFLFSTLLDCFYIFYLKLSFEATAINMKLLSTNWNNIYMRVVGIIWAQGIVSGSSNEKIEVLFTAAQ